MTIVHVVVVIPLSSGQCQSLAMMLRVGQPGVKLWYAPVCPLQVPSMTTLEFLGLWLGSVCLGQAAALLFVPRNFLVWHLSVQRVLVIVVSHSRRLRIAFLAH